MSDVVSGNTELGATKQELIASLVQKELAFQAKLVPTVTDFSSFAVPGAKSISFPRLTSFTVINRDEAVAGPASALTATLDTMLLDKNAYVAYVIDSMTALQSNIAAQLEYARFAAAAHARYVDNQIIDVLRNAYASAEVTGTDGDLTHARILSMREKILKADGDLSRTTLIVSPKQEAAILNLAEYKNADAFGQATLPSGNVPSILGMRVVVHNGLEDKEAYVYDAGGLAIGFQKQPSMSEQLDNQYGTGAVRVAIDQLFGVKAMQTALKGASAGKSPLIIALND
jgi:hypothetical protein